MKIKKVDINNFRGIKRASFELPHIAAICGKNGAGKTSLLNALRYALTGEEPEGDIIRYDANSTEVSVEIEDVTSGTITLFTRIKERGKPSKFKINGKATTQKALNDTIQSVTGLGIDNLKILSSDEVVSMMKPQEFGSLILGYIPEKMTLEKVMKFIPTATAGMVDIIDANLPVEDISIESLDEFEKTVRSTRKELKAELASKKLLLDKYVQENPGKSLEEVENALKVLFNVENEYKLYEEKLKAYNTARENREKMIKCIKDLKAEAEAISVTRPDPAALDTLAKKKQAIEQRIYGQKSALAGVNQALITLKATLEAIDKSVCPISPLITCKTDKTVAKQEIVDTIAATEEAKTATEAEIETLKEEFAAIESEREEIVKNTNLYEKKISLAKQARSMEESLPAEPEAPAPVEKKDVETEKFQLEHLRENIKSYEEGLRIKAQIEDLEREVSDYEELVKALSEKGPIRTGVVETYLGIFEEICNDRSSSIRPEITFQFRSEGGVVVYMNDSSKGTSLTINELSRGERAYMIYILIDMLNELIGAKLLVLDELSVMDAETFNYLLDLVLAHSENYDHVLLSAVNHTEIVDGFKSHEINNLFDSIL